MQAMTTQTPVTFSTRHLADLVNDCKAEGLRVFVRPSDTGKHTYAYVTDGTGIAYIQADMLTISISTVHKPCRECGTGFRLDLPPNVESAKAAMAMVAPSWASKSDRRAVRKWDSWKHYANSTHGKWSELIES